MPEWSSPLWLAGLAAVPLVWWLHRFRRQDVPQPVSALFLWSGPPTVVDNQHQATRTDPWWRLRALLVSLLVFGMAGPHWPGERAQTLELWVDDSPSLQALEDGVPRARLALAALDEALARHGAGTLLIHSLRNPAWQLRLAANQREEWIGRIGDWLQTIDTEPLPPAGRQMSPRHQHWLLSDGADPRLDSWLEDAPLARIVQAGRETENVAVRRLALRSDLAHPGRIRGLVAVENLGRTAASRRLVVRDGQRILAEFQFTLEAGERQQRGFGLDATPTAPVEARLTPTDALPTDDTLVVDPQSLAALPVQTAGSCPPRLRTALDGHPGLRIASARETAGLRVVCTPEPPRGDMPTIWLHTGATTVPVSADPLWLPEAGTLRRLVLQPIWLRRFQANGVPAGQPWLEANGVPLVVYRPGPAPRLEVFVDMASPPWTRRPEYPLFLAGLVDQLIGRPLLDPVASASRPREASLIAPRSRRAAAGRKVMVAGTASGGPDLGLYLILTAALLLGLDLWRQRPGHRPPHGATPS